MSTTALKDALKNCQINFDRRVNVTELLQEYTLTYEEVHQSLEEYLRQQEAKGVKYEKRFLVQGVEKDSKDEVYTVVQGEKKLQEWLNRLQQAQASLYTVEVEGGSKSPAYAFKALERPAIKLQSLEVRDVKSKVPPAAKLTNGSTSTTIKAAVKEESKPVPKKSAAVSMFGKQTENSGTSKNSGAPAEQPKKSPPSAKKSPPETKKSAAEEKKAKAAATAKKGIGNFFAPAVKKEDNKKDVKPSSPQKDKKYVKPSSPQKDFFQKQSEKTKTTASPVKKAAAMKKDAPAKKGTHSRKSTPPKEAADISVQLFDEESSDASSDEESKLDALKRNIISSDHEMDTDSVDHEAAASSSTSNKRRRIVDSSDEDEAVVEPKKKLERQDSDTVIVNLNDDDDIKPKIEPVSEQPPQSETYLDEDGFVITIKPKKKGAAKASSSKSTKKSPSNRSPRKSPAKSAATKSAAKPATAVPKTKQGNIMSFFTKK